jgi:hypothetical protein
MASSHLSLRRWYRYYNKLYFNNELPDDVNLIWAPLNGVHAQTDRQTIWMDPQTQLFPKFMRTTLLHEMAHISCSPRASHGPVFQAEIDRLYAAGAFRRLL